MIQDYRSYYFGDAPSFRQVTLSNQDINQIKVFLQSLIEHHRSAIESVAIAGQKQNKLFKIEDQIIVHSLEWKRLNNLLSKF